VTRGAVIGTAGHVDHGKTTLVRALTGIDTDRLPEERARGISIELGFAWLDRPLGRVAFVDVPGHERFVRQMIAGAAGMDAVLFVVAADEGVMPQTREHLDICRLLGITRGVVVLTKTDLVAADWLALVHDDVAQAVRGTFLEGRPIVPFANGDEALREGVVAAIDALVDDIASAARPLDRPFALPIDRVFTTPGFGTIVTGTSHSGVLAVGDRVLLEPAGIEARVRALEVHGERVERADPGQRVAVNLPALEVADVARSGLLTHVDGPRPTSMIEATFTAIERLPLPIEDGEKGLLHLGTERVEVTLALLGGVAPPGVEVVAQLRLAQPIAFAPGSRYVLRGFRSWAGRHDLGLTLGGGRALAPGVRRLRAGDAAYVHALQDVRRAPAAWIGAHGEAGVTRAEVLVALPYDRASIAASLAGAEVLAIGDRLWAWAALLHLEAAIVAAVASYHDQHPGRVGVRADELRTRVRPEAAPELFEAIVDRLVRARRLVRRASEVAATGFVPKRIADEALCAALVERLQAGGLTPPSIADLPGALDCSPALVREAIELTIKAGQIVRVTPELVFAKAALVALEGTTRVYFAHHDRMDAQALKELTGASRRYAIPLGEWLDRARVTVRVGDERRLRG